MKKTTVYLSDQDLSLLRKKAAVLNKSVADVIRRSIQKACQPESKEEAGLWESLDRIWIKTSKLAPEKIESAVHKAVSEARRARIKTHRRP